MASTGRDELLLKPKDCRWSDSWRTPRSAAITLSEPSAGHTKPHSGIFLTLEGHSALARSPEQATAIAPSAKSYRLRMVDDAPSPRSPTMRDGPAHAPRAANEVICFLLPPLSFIRHVWLPFLGVLGGLADPQPFGLGRCAQPCRGSSI